MRPHRLTFAGIGAYPGRVEVDFDALNEKGLYLIVGPTGAGKTTILDAITCALYGKVAQGRTLVSTHDGALPAMVELEFSQGTRRYTVHRELAPPGRTTQPQKQWIRTFEAGIEVATETGTMAVNGSCAGIVGLSADEFMQVILLPQGKFQQFLLAAGGDKQSLLKSIFRTGTYERLARQLKEQAEQLRQDVARDEEQAGTHWAVIDSVLETLRSHDAFDAQPDPRPDPRPMVAFLERVSGELSGLATNALQRQTELAAQRQAAAALAQKFDDAAQLEQLRSDHESERKRSEELRGRIDDHQRSQPVARAAEALRSAVKAAEAASEEATSRRTQLQRETGRFKVDESVVKTWRDGIPTASHGTLTGELASLTSRLVNIERRHAEIRDLLAQADGNAEEAEAVQGDIQGLTADIKRCRQEAKAAVAAYTSAKARLKGLPAATKKYEELCALLEESDVDGASRDLERATTAHSKAQAAFTKALNALQQAFDRNSRHLAGQLASSLSPGVECPVCGSTKHPKKAATAAASTADISTLQEKRDAAQRKLVDAENDLKVAQKALQTAKHQKAKLPTVAQQAKIEREHESLTELNDTIDDLDAEADATAAELGELEGDLADARNEATRIATEGRGLAKQIADHRRATEAVGPAQTISAALEICKKLEKLLAELGRFAEALTEANGKVAATEHALERALKESGFPSEEAARACVVEDERLSEFQRWVDAYDSRAITIGQLEAVVGNDPIPDTRPDLDEVSARLSEAETKVGAAAAVATTAKNALQQVTPAASEIERIGAGIEHKRQRAGTATDIAKTFMGDAAGRLGLERWVQRTLFEEVCLVANDQLRSLSNNRFSLTLDPQEGGVKKSHGGGLDIYVLDAHTGRTLPVQSMSGGEQFMASLSLALALAEVVQRHAGGVELPCLFIDEGFGGLDIDSLDLAIEVLTKIQAAGRTVGIITHVEAMQQQLPIGIRVNKSDRGSTLEVLVA